MNQLFGDSAYIGWVNLYRLARPFAFTLEAERAHRATIAALKLTPTRHPPHFPKSLCSTVAGLKFPSPVGLAAGFDKDAEVVEEMLGWGFGFVEVGTLTPREQAGNPRPRLFRLRKDRAVVNRMGFNNRGQPSAYMRLKLTRHLGIVGVNVGANKSSMTTSRGAGRQDGLGDDAIADYVGGVRAMSDVADYLTINISSPNTPGLRGLQDQGALEELLQEVRKARRAKGPPVFLKVAPDFEPGDPERIVRAAIDHGIDALIVSNTTITRPELKSKYGAETGGLSGRPLKSLALDALRQFRSAGGGQIPLIGVGGISTVDDAWERIRAGASLVQVYTAMVYEGPGIARRIALGLARRLKREGMSSIADVVGSE